MTTNDTLALIVRDPNGQDIAAVRWTIDAERIASSYGAGATVRYRSGETLWTVPARYVRGDGDAAITFAIVALANKQAETAAAIGDLEAMMREHFPAPAVDVRNRGDRHRAGYCTHGVDLKLACADCTAKYGKSRTYVITDDGIEPMPAVESDDEREHREHCEAAMAAHMVCQHGRTDEEGCEDCDELIASLAPRQNEPDVEDASKYATCDEYHAGNFRPCDSCGGPLFGWTADGKNCSSCYAGELGSDFAGATVLEGADRAEFGPKL